MTLGTIAIELAFAAISLGVIILLAKSQRGKDTIQPRREDDDQESF